jgi:ubiquinol-cytochrome c reductase cytochrome b subunit
MSDVTNRIAAPPASRRARFWDAFDRFTGLRTAFGYEVPAHANKASWSLGGITAFLFVVEVATGIWMVQFYDPSPTGANQSVRHFMTSTPGGSIIQGVHFWGAHAMYVTLVLHLLRVWWTGAFKRPRVINWFVGVVMFALTTLLLFTGTVIVWTQEGYEALEHNVDLGKMLGLAGGWFTSDFARNVPIIDRLYGAHIMILPFVLFVAMAVHLMYVRFFKISPDPHPEGKPERAPERFTEHLKTIGQLSLAVLGLLVLLAVFLPPSVGSVPVAGLEITKPPWEFWWMFTLENWMSVQGILWGGAALFIILALVPILDRNPEKRWWRQRKLAISIGILVILAWGVLTILMPLLPQKAHLGM